MRRLIIILAFLATPIARAQTPQNYTLSGVVSGPSGPVPNVTINIRSFDFVSRVQLIDKNVSTDAQGRFSTPVPAGSLAIGCLPPGGSALGAEFFTSINLVRDLAIRCTLSARVTVSGQAPGATRVELWSLTRRASQSTPVTNGNFQVSVAGDRYAIHAVSDRGIYFGRTNVDARDGDVRNVVVATRAAGEPLLTPIPPRASLISTSTPDADGMTTVRGAAGSVDPISPVLLVNPQTSHISQTVSDLRGAFTAPMFGPPGSRIQVIHDPTGFFLGWRTGDPNLEAGASTLISVPLQPSAAGIAYGMSASIDYYGAVADGRSVDQINSVGFPDPGQWYASGTIDPSQWEAGRSFSISGNLSLFSRDFAANPNLSALKVAGVVQLERLFDAAGTELEPHLQFMSSVLTPTGLPIQRHGGPITVTPNWTVDPPRLVGDRRAESTWRSTVTIPANLPAGTYRIAFQLDVSGLPPHDGYFDVLPVMESSAKGALGGAAMIRIGAPKAPRLTWLALADDVVNGSRGAVAVEDRDHFRLAPNVLTMPDRLTLPMVDARSGTSIKYRLEPFVPMISSSTGSIIPPESIVFKFPSGGLRVSVTRPDGVTTELGSAPFQQPASRTPITPNGRIMAAENGRASQRLTNVLQLSTMDPAFDYVFTQYGLHRISMTGTIEDMQGNVYSGGGTYEVMIGRTLDFETSVMPGTPFEVGDKFAPALVLQPPVPADVEMRIRLLPNSDTTKTIERVVRGRANRFGYFTPDGIDPIVLSAAGEYRVDISATYIDDQNVTWNGEMTWGSIVETPGSSLITHGRRGFDEADRIQSQWFRVRESRTGLDHVMYPFHTGDVMWMDKEDPAADIPKITIQDSTGSLAQRVRSRNAERLETPSLNDRIVAGEIPLFSSTSTGRSPSFEPEAIDQWGYFYAFAERPGVRVRELLSEDYSDRGYWRFHDNYLSQLGTGVNGDLPNDFKFQFGGAVYRKPGDNFYYYGAYASLFVMIASSDPIGGRIFPPFQGAAGGPTGGPLFRLKGKDIDIFFHPTGTRPGSILESGNTASFAGQIAPTLPSKVRLTVTSPSGKVREIFGQANKVGYFFKPETDFRVDEEGAWRVKVSVFHDGLTSAGPVQAPFPTGDVLGSNNGEFRFFVVSPSAPELGVNVGRDGFVRLTPNALAITAELPAGLSNVRLQYTSVMPGFILEDGSSSSLTYSYNATQLNRDFPNLDISDSEGLTGVDSISISLLVSGTDASGKTVYRARQVLLEGEELLALPMGTRTYSVTERGASTFTTAGAVSNVQVGYARLQPAAAASTPAGLAIFGVRQGGVLVSEATVPAAVTLRSGRIYAEIGGGANTGVAMANPGTQEATITFFFTDANGLSGTPETMRIAAAAHIAAFLNQAPFNAGASFSGTFTFNSSVPIAVTALRGLTNERSEFLITTLPVTDLSETVSTGPLLFPHFADGAGWTSQIVLVNPTDSSLSGTVRFIGTATTLQDYTIPPRSSRRFATAGTGSDVATGSVQIVPNSGQSTPAGIGVFSYRKNGVTVTEAGVPAVRAGTAFRLYGETGSAVQTGLAISQTGASTATVIVELIRLDGTSIGLTGTLSIPANGHVAKFLNEIPGLEAAPVPFQGLVRVSTGSTAGISLVGLRGRTNERGDYLITTTPPVNESSPPLSSELVFAHFADGGGYTTQFVVFSPAPGRTSSGTIRLLGSAGQPIQPN